MDGDHQTLEALLKDNLAIAQENNRILREMQRMDRIVLWVKIVVWTLVIILPLIFIGPILDFIMQGFGVSVMGLPSPEMMEEALRLYGGGE